MSLWNFRFAWVRVSEFLGAYKKMDKLSLLAMVSDMQSNLSSSLSLTLLCVLAEGNGQVCQKLTSSYNLLEVNDQMKCNYIVLGTLRQDQRKLLQLRDFVFVSKEGWTNYLISLSSVCV